jgi:hypothetical protein
VSFGCISPIWLFSSKLHGSIIFLGPKYLIPASPEIGQICPFTLKKAKNGQICPLDKCDNMLMINALRDYNSGML